MPPGAGYAPQRTDGLAIASLISPYEADRVRAREVHGGLPFVEVFVDTPLEVCEARDPKGMYAKGCRAFARSGSNRRGSNRSASSQCSGLRCVP